MKLAVEENFHVNTQPYREEYGDTAEHNMGGEKAQNLAKSFNRKILARPQCAALVLGFSEALLREPRGTSFSENYPLFFLSQEACLSNKGPL